MPYIKKKKTQSYDISIILEDIEMDKSSGDTLYLKMLKDHIFKHTQN